MAQTITVNGTPMLVSDDISFPFWLESGSSISPEVPVSSISVLEFNIVPNNNGNDMVFNQVISVTEEQTVPEGKTWKVESVLIGNESNSMVNLNPNTFIAFDESGVNLMFNEPVFYTDKIYFKTEFINHPSNVTEFGFCLSSDNPQPSIYDNKFQVTEYYSENPHKFDLELTFDSLNHKYVRAYAVNDLGITYSLVEEIIRPNYFVGKIVEDGIIFHLDESENTGLIAAFHSPLIYKWCNDSFIDNLSTEIGSGLENTNIISQNCQLQNNAASAALEYVSPSGIDDWYLPSKDELNHFWGNITSLNSERSLLWELGYGNSSNYNNYWTSSQESIDKAYHLQIYPSNVQYNGGLGYWLKANEYQIIPIRNFNY